jgi:hypothetical protein
VIESVTQIQYSGTLLSSLLLNKIMFPSTGTIIFVLIVQATIINIVSGFLNSPTSFKLLRVRYYSPHYSSSGYDSECTIEDIRADVEKYISLRNAAIPDQVNGTLSGDYEKFENPLEMFKPTGWYKDEITLELATRSDKRIPKVSHPLAFAELQRFGFDNLSNPIMLLGGPHEVGIKLNLGWVEPLIEKTVYSEEEKVLISTTYLFDNRGRLKLGGAQDESMESSAAQLDLGALKRAIKIKDDLSSNVSNQDRNADLFKRDADGQINYKESKAPLKKESSYVLTESKVPKSERFSLGGAQRAYMVFTCFSTALAHGRASQELLLSDSNSFGLNLSSLSDLVTVATIISNALIIFAVVSSSFSFKTARLKNRNPVVWALKGLLGGPLTALQLRDLDVLSD